MQNYIKSNNKIGGIKFLLSNFDINKIPIKLSNFHRQALLSWVLVYKHSYYDKSLENKICFSS